MYQHANQSGNVLFMILVAIVLIGVLTVALQSTSQTGNENIDRETYTIRFSEIKQYASEIENAVRFIFVNNFSESDLRFSHPDAHADYGDITDTPERQIFSRSGGGANYSLPPSGVNDGSAWEFYGETHMPSVGSSNADLVMVLPNVTSGFCDFINEKLGYTGQPEDTGTCVNAGASGRFDGGTLFAAVPNTTNEASFSQTPSMQACVQCGSDSSRHYVHVIMPR